MKLLDRRSKGVWWKEVHRHRIVLIQHPSILNPKRKLWVISSQNLFSIQNGAGNSSTVPSWLNEIATITRPLSSIMARQWGTVPLFL